MEEVQEQQEDQQHLGQQAVVIHCRCSAWW
jgi:hypothetical protein